MYNVFFYVKACPIKCNNDTVHPVCPSLQALCSSVRKGLHIVHWSGVIFSLCFFYCMCLFVRNHAAVGPIEELNPKSILIFVIKCFLSSIVQQMFSCDFLSLFLYLLVCVLSTEQFVLLELIELLKKRSMLPNIQMYFLLKDFIIFYLHFVFASFTNMT